ncbi:MAG: S8 family serine peptidase [Bacteroidota bacterium]
MKDTLNRIAQFCLVISSIPFLSGCSHSEEPVLPSLEKESGIVAGRRQPRRPDLSNQRLVKDQLVIKYRNGTHDTTKAMLRKKYFAKEIKRCNCADETLELWWLNLDSLQGGIEEIKGEVSSEPDLEGSDFQYVFNKPNTYGTINGENLSWFTQLVKRQNDGITVAIIDSGLDFDHLGFTRRFLYNSRQSGNFCREGVLREISGWDFVDQDPVPEDRHRHGTIVTDILFRKLDETISYQVLPVRAFNEDGKGTSFDITCAVRFVTRKPDVAIMNMSFGWYGISLDILATFIREVEDEMVIITSSGNQGIDNDIFAHYPSGYDYTNILSVAAIDSLGEYLSDFSNFGAEAVDIAAEGVKIPFTHESGTVYVDGTSFSSASATARCVQIYNPSYLPVDQIDWLTFHSVENSLLTGKMKHPNVLIP